MDRELIGYCVRWNKMKDKYIDGEIYLWYQELEAKCLFREVQENGFSDVEIFPVYK